MYTRNRKLRQRLWNTGTYFRKVGQNAGVYRLEEWLPNSTDLAWCGTALSDYTAKVLVTIDGSCYRVRKDGQDYKRTSELSVAACRNNLAKGRVQGIRSNLHNLIRSEFPESAPVTAKLIHVVEDLSAQFLDALDTKWLYTKDGIKRAKAKRELAQASELLQVTELLIDRGA